MGVKIGLPYEVPEDKLSLLRGTVGLNWKKLENIANYTMGSSIFFNNSLTNKLTPRIKILLDKFPLVKKFPMLIWNPKIRCHVRKSTPLDPSRIHTNPVHTLTSYILGPALIIPTHLP
jgi:hypothetical protein